MTKASFHTDIPTEHLAALGRVVIAQESMHDMLAWAVQSLLRVDDRVATIITAGQPFKATSRLLGALVAEVLGETEGTRAVLAAVRQAEGAEDRRNELIHSIWIADGKGGARRSKTSIRQRTLRENACPVSVADIDDVTTRMAGAMLQLMKQMTDELIRSGRMTTSTLFRYEDPASAQLDGQGS